MENNVRQNKLSNSHGVPYTALIHRGREPKSQADDPSSSLDNRRDSPGQFTNCLMGLLPERVQDSLWDQRCTGEEGEGKKHREDKRVQSHVKTSVFLGDRSGSIPPAYTEDKVLANEKMATDPRGPRACSARD